MMTVRPVVALIGALDTKGAEFGYLRDRLVEAGCRTLLLDTGVQGEPTVRPDIDRDEVARAAGTSVEALISSDDRSVGMEAMASGAASILERLHLEDEIGGLLAMGGSNAAYVMSIACAALPIGFPKLLVSTMAAGDTRPYVGYTDLTLMHPVVDVNGLNRVSKKVLTNAAKATAGMALGYHESDFGTASVAAITMFGVTTECGRRLAEVLQASGIEPLTFHATGVGGRTMEALVSHGQIQAVADMTTTELADELAGGVCSAGPDRLTAAGSRGLPQVVSLGALDMVNFGPPETVPPRYRGRLFHQHNPSVTLMRTTAEECDELGRRLAEKLNASTGQVAVVIPEAGFSQISTPGQPFHDPAADSALISSLTSHLDAAVRLHRFPTDINDPVIAATAARVLIDWVEEGA